MDRDIRVFKLQNNTECIGEVVVILVDSNNEPYLYTFRKLRAFAYVNSGQPGQVNIGFQNFFIPAEDADIPIRARDIMCILPAPIKIENGYLAAVSPIQLASAMPRGNVIEGRVVG